MRYPLSNTRRQSVHLSSSIKVPRAIAKWAARPLAASAQISGANACQRQAESQQIKQKGWL